EPTVSAADLNRPWSRSRFDDAELAGLPPNTRLGTLDWARAHALAEGRSPVDVPGPGSRPVGAAEIDKLSGRGDQGSFASFRAGFLGSPGGATAPHDLAGEILDLLLSRQRVEGARWNVAAFENLVRVMSELIEFASRDVSQLELDQVD